MYTIIQGDALDELHRLPSASVSLLLTDPPYGDNIGYGLKNRTIANNQHPLHGLQALHESYRVLKRNAVAYFFLGARHLSFVENFVRDYTDFKIKEYLVWDKMRFGLGYAYRKQHELILALEKGKPTYYTTLSNVIRTKRCNNTTEHPHMKPIELLMPLINHSTTLHETILDPFLGSGSTLVAAKLLGRSGIGIELDPGYVAVAQSRLEQTQSTLLAAE